MVAYEEIGQQEIDNLWQAYQAQRTEAIRERLILLYAPLVKKIVGRMGLRPNGPVEWDDLLNYGVLGLIDAVERYEPSRGIAFQTFASLRIRGAVLDSLRQIDPLGRLARRRVRAAKNAVQQLTVELGRVPDDDEVAAAIGLTADQYKQVLQDASFMILSLEQPLRNGGGEQMLLLGDVLEDPKAEASLDAIEDAEMRERLAHSIRSLSRREQILLSLYYYEGLTIREVAEVMEISQTRVCQIHARSIMSLKSMMNSDLPKSEQSSAYDDVDPEPNDTADERLRSFPTHHGIDRRRTRPSARRQWLEMFGADQGADSRSK